MWSAVLLLQASVASLRKSPFGAHFDYNGYLCEKAKKASLAHFISIELLSPRKDAKIRKDAKKP